MLRSDPFVFPLYLKLTEEDGLSKGEAARRVRKSHLFYYGTLEQRDDEPLGFCGKDLGSKLNYTLYALEGKTREKSDGGQPLTKNNGCLPIRLNK